MRIVALLVILVLAAGCNDQSVSSDGRSTQAAGDLPEFNQPIAVGVNYRLESVITQERISHGRPVNVYSSSQHSAFHYTWDAEVDTTATVSLVVEDEISGDSERILEIAMSPGEFDRGFARCSLSHEGVFSCEIDNLDEKAQQSDISRFVPHGNTMLDVWKEICAPGYQCAEVHLGELIVHTH